MAIGSNQFGSGDDPQRREGRASLPHGPASGTARGFELLTALETQAKELSGLLDDVEPPGVLDFIERIELLHRQIAMLRARALTRGQDSGLWEVAGSRSFAAWMSTRLGSDPAEVRKTVREAAALRDHLPQMAQAAQTGAISWGHVSSTVRTALGTEKQRSALSHGEVGESFLVEQAKFQAVPQFRRLVNAWAHRADPDAGDARWQKHRDDEYLVLAKTLGGYHLQGWLSDINGKTLASAINAAVGVAPEGDTRTLQERNAQGLTDIAAAALSSGTFLPHTHIRPHLLVTVDYETLQRLVGSGAHHPNNGVSAQNTARGFQLEAQPALDDGTVLTESELAYVSCDSSVTRIIFGPQSEVLNVGRAKRTVTGGQRKAVHARDRHCQYPGCGAYSPVSEVHHVKHWAAGGETSVDNSILLCRHHHQHVHARNIRIKRKFSTWVFFTADGVPINLQKHANRSSGHRAERESELDGGKPAPPQPDP